jgi:hypothetical protein
MMASNSSVNKGSRVNGSNTKRLNYSNSPFSETAMVSDNSGLVNTDRSDNMFAFRPNSRLSKNSRIG